MKAALAGAFEEVFVLLGDPEPARRQMSITMDKLKELVVSHRQTRLGLEVNTRTMMVDIPQSFITDVVNILSLKWPSSRCTVNVNDLQKTIRETWSYCRYRP